MRSLVAGALLCLSVSAPSQSFQAAPILNTPHDPIDCVSADFNRDGKLDLAYIDITNSVTLLLGRGGTNFQAQPSIPLKLSGGDGNTSNILTADINGDGKPDLVVISEVVVVASEVGETPVTAFTNSIQIDTLLGNGDGTFQPSRTSFLSLQYTTNDSFYAVENGFPATGQGALADFNGDGKLDLAIPDPHNGSLYVVAGDGAGLFTSYAAGVLQSANGVPGGPGQAIAVDINGDGHPDLIVLYQAEAVTSPIGGNLTTTIQAPGTISVYVGNGDGSFLPPTQPSQTAASLLVADINGDGHPDLITTQLDDSVQILTGNGDGTFVALPEMPLANGAPVWVAGVGDYNRDGVADLAGQNGVAILLGLGALQFGSPAQFPAGGLQRYLAPGTTGEYPPLLTGWGYGLFNPVVFGDLDGDGKTDLIVRGSGGFALLLGNGDGAFQSATAYELNHFPSGLEAADFNLDGNPDIAAAVGPNLTRILLNKGNGTLNLDNDPAPGVPNPTTIGVLRAGDVNGDGFPDLLGVQNGAWLQFGDGQGAVGGAQALRPATPCCAAVADFNNDGLSDVALVDEQGAYFLTSSTGGEFATFTAPLADPFPIGYNFVKRAISLDDFNRDGNVDAAVLSLNYVSGIVTLQILLGNGDGTFALGQSFSTAKYPPSVLINPFPISLFTPRLADVNGDGKPDILVPDMGAVQILYGNGDGTFQPPAPMNALTGNLTIPTVADFNFDGIPDLVLTDFGEASVMYGKGGEVFGPPHNYATGDWPEPAVVADLNGDGAPDLVFGAGTDAVVMLNIPPPGSLPIEMNLAVSPEPSASQQPFTVSATVSAVISKNGTPTGAVAFSIDGQSLATVALSAGAASTVDNQPPAPGEHTVTAVYSGDSKFHGYTLSTQHVVLGLPVTISLNGAPNPAVPGQSVVFTAQVASTMGTPAGPVNFLFLDGVTPEGTATLDSKGLATYTACFGDAGPHRLKASYSGGGIYSASASAVYTETVNSGSGTCGSGSASGGPDFAISIAPQIGSVRLGLAATFTVAVTALNGFSQAIDLSCGGTLPPETSCSFSPVTVAGGSGSATWTFTTTPPHTIKAFASPSVLKVHGAGIAFAACLGLLFFPRRGRGRWLLVLLLCLSASWGCGNGNIDPGTPFGNFTVTVTGTSEGSPALSHSVAFKMKVY